MCMIALRPAGDAHIPSAVIDAAMGRHPDGFGYAARIGGHLVTATFAPNERTAFKAALAKLDATGAEYAAHFRFATSGPKTRDMSHPYTYEDPDPAVGTVALVHNGIIAIAHERSKESDTSAFVRLVLARLPSRWWANPALVYLVEESIGWSKFVLMTAGETFVLGEKSGEWDAGLWYSSPHRPAYMPGKATASPGNVPSKHAQRRQRAKARRDGALIPQLPAVTTEDAFVPEPGMRGGGYPSLRHNGHAMTATTPINREKDGTYLMGAVCDECRTFADVYVIDGTVYMDGSHHDVAVSV